MKNAIQILRATVFAAATISLGYAQASSTPEPPEPGRTVAPVYQPKRETERRSRATPASVTIAGMHPLQERASHSLIVQTSKADSGKIDQLREDLAVMARLIERSASGYAGEPDKVLGLDILVHGQGAARNFYLEGYGVVFTLNANMPLRPPAKRSDSENNDEHEENADWESARSELFGSKRQTAVQFAWTGQRFGREYNEEAVARLKDGLLDTLRNAAKIRHLKDDEAVTIVVRSTEFWVGEEFALRNAGIDADSTLVISARKKDIDAFAKKNIGRSEFRKRAQINLY
jgi:hypothetical protein